MEHYQESASELSYKEGWKRGSEQTRAEIACSMLYDGVALKHITQYTMLSEARVKELAASIGLRYKDGKGHNMEMVSITSYLFSQEYANQLRYEDGYRECVELGKLERKEEMARSMLENGMSIELAAECTELPTERVKALAEAMGI